MKPFIDLEEYDRSVYRLFGNFPFLIMVAACFIAYGIGILMGMAGMGGMDDPIGMEGISNGFFRGVLVSVGAFYLGRMAAVSVVKSASNLEQRDDEGVFIPCMSHKTIFDFSTGYIMIMPGRLYFEPRRPFGGDRTFDYYSYDGFRFTLSKPRESIGLFLLTTEKYMLAVEDGTGKRLGTFIIPEPEKHLPLIQELI